MNTLLIALLAMFGFGAGAFLGSGNYNGLLGALIPGIVTGLLVSIPSLREHDWNSALLLIALAVIGSVVITQVSDDNGLKRMFREQKMLVVHIGSYKLGG